MIIALILFLAVGVLVMVGPAAAFGLVTGLLTAKLAAPVRIGLLLLVAAGQTAAWALLLASSDLVPAVAFLVGLATLASGAGGVAWSTRRTRATGYLPAGPPTWHHGSAW
ncbi:hypothetical protein [Kitasatospora sp. P5_F3]